MPPNSIPGSGASVQERVILQPANRVTLNEGGLPSTFGRFVISSSKEQLAASIGVVIGVYASGGTGKTTFFCSIADRKLNPEGHDLPMLLLDAEAGIKSVLHLVGPDLQTTTIKSFYDVEQWIELVEAQPKALFPWRSVYLDNLSDLIQKALAEQGYHNKANSGPGVTSSQPDYAAMTTRVTLALQKLRDLAIDYGFNLFVSLWESVEKNSSGDILGYHADVTPKLAIRIQGILDYIGYMTVLKTPVVVNGKLTWIRKLDFSPNPELDAKWRVTPDKADEIPLELYQPTLPAILDTIKRGKPFNKAKFVKPLGSTGK